MKLTPMEKAQAAELLGMSSRSTVLTLSNKICQIRKITPPGKIWAAAAVVKQFVKNPDPVLWADVPPGERDIFLSVLDR